MGNNLSELENTLCKAEGLRDLLGIVADCSSEGAQSLDNFNMAFFSLSCMAYEIVKELTDEHKKLYEDYREMRKVAK